MSHRPAEGHAVRHERAGRPRRRSRKLPGFEEATPDTVAAVLEEAAKFATNVLAPLNVTGDREGAQLARRTARSRRRPGSRTRTGSSATNGWNGLTKNPEFGGQGLPQLVATAGRGDVARLEPGVRPVPAADPGRDRGASSCAARRRAEGAVPAEDGRAATWTGTMNLTEPQAGSDLAAVRTRAVPQGDGTTGSTARRSSSPTASTTRPRTSSIWCSRARRTRRRASRASRCSSCRSSWSTPTARSARATTCIACRSSTSSASTPARRRARLRRPRRRGRLSRRRGEPRPRVHVHHDERGALLGRHGGRRHRRARLPARRRLRARARAGQARSARTRAPTAAPSSTIPTSAAC